jgi:hypothetical protein
MAHSDDGQQPDAAFGMGEEEEEYELDQDQII